MNPKTKVLILFAALALSACGGGGDDNGAPAPAVTTQVPAEASMSVSGFLSYLKALVVASADAFEPVDVSTVTPPADDAAEPAPVD